MNKKIMTLAAAIGVALLTLPAGAAEARIVSFNSDDGVALSGLWYGEGDEVVILSHQYDLDQSAWAKVADTLAGQGYGVLTYNFRGYPPSGGKHDIGEIGHDLAGAIAFAQAQGATQLILAGASRGGIVTVPAAVTAKPVGYITLSAPLGFAGLAADDASLLTSPAAKLFINSEGDQYLPDTQHMFDVASEPKTLEVYPGSAHAMSMFARKEGPAVQARIVTFINDVMPL